MLIGISIIFLWIQIRDLRKSVQSATYQTIVSMFDEFAKLCIEHPEIDRLLFQDSDALWNNDSKTPTVQKIQALWAIAMRFDWFESIVIQKKKYNTIPDDLYQHWISVLREEMSFASFRKYWNTYKQFYHPYLHEEINRLPL